MLNTAANAVSAPFRQNKTLPETVTEGLNTGGILCPFDDQNIDQNIEVGKLVTVVMHYYLAHEITGRRNREKMQTSVAAEN